ncbi:MAG: hypothetical protein K9W43_02130 [Candidatus Thorarchaeota archaeon]|nr:hypothetical protein [Candidatus Thorarchaeota archaeon]
MAEVGLTINREIEDVKAQVRQELNTIRELLDEFGYRDSSPGWDTPFQLFKLRRAMRVHYMALRMRDVSASPLAEPDMIWELKHE